MLRVKKVAAKSKRLAQAVIRSADITRLRRAFVERNYIALPELISSRRVPPLLPARRQMPPAGSPTRRGQLRLHGLAPLTPHHRATWPSAT